MCDLDVEFQTRSGSQASVSTGSSTPRSTHSPCSFSGLNLGGETDGTDLNTSDDYCENGKDDNVAFRGHGRMYLLGSPQVRAVPHNFGRCPSTVLATKVIPPLAQRQLVRPFTPRRRSRELAALEDLLRSEDPQAILAGSRVHVPTAVRPPAPPRQLRCRAAVTGQHAHRRWTRTAGSMSPPPGLDSPEETLYS
jgi:hypothetical protein